MTDQNLVPLLAALEGYLQREYVPFHMPGHKGGRGTRPSWQGLIGRPALHLDLTELDGLDDLHNPRGPIGEAQRLAADLMGAAQARFLVNGVSVGIGATVAACCQPGDKIIIPRNSHRSVYSAVAISGAVPVYLMPEVDGPSGLPLGVRVADAAAALERHPDARALLMIHPTYHGLVSDLAPIAAAAQKLGVKVIADEAHGPHFKFSRALPATALESGADLAVQGWHKTMGSLTQSALLLQAAEEPAVDQRLMMLQTTSPSYLLMASLDAARQNWALDGAEMADQMLDRAWELRRGIQRIPGIRCLDQTLIAGTAARALDPTKIVISGREIGLNGYQLSRLLRDKYGIEAEMAETGWVTLMVTIGDDPRGNSRLLHALAELARPGETPLAEMKIDTYPQPHPAMTPGEALRRQTTPVPVHQAAGRVAGEFLCPYPPGVPLLVPGELISREIILHAQEIQGLGGRIQGMRDPSMRTVQVIAE